MNLIGIETIHADPQSQIDELANDRGELWIVSTGCEPEVDDVRARIPVIEGMTNDLVMSEPWDIVDLRANLDIPRPILTRDRLVPEPSGNLAEIFRTLDDPHADFLGD